MNPEFEPKAAVSYKLHLKDSATVAVQLEERPTKAKNYFGQNTVYQKLFSIAQFRLWILLNTIYENFIMKMLTFVCHIRS